MSTGTRTLAGPARPVTLAAPAARSFALLALATFGALHWMAMLEPAAYSRAWYAALAAGAAIAGLLGAARLRPRLRTAAAVAVAIAAFALALLGGGVADELLRPDRWGELAAGIDRGIASLPGARVPYRGLDEWTRIVLGVGGTVIVVAAALLAFWPRAQTLGFRHVALILLVTLYVVPAVALDFEGEFLRGAALALLVLAYLRLETIGIGDAGAAGMLAVGMAVLGLVVAPALDKDTPWWDYETWALSTASAKSTSFTWNHTYGVLDWPRDGRELLRVKARRAAYWKALNLDEFNGRRWVRGVGTPNLDGCALDAGFAPPGMREQWLQEIKVSVRNLNTTTFVTAGIACAIDAPRLARLPLGDGVYATVTRSLRRGDAYSATVYAPSPTERERQAAPFAYPPNLQRFTQVQLPGADPDRPSREERSDVTVQFPFFADGGPPLARPSAQPALDFEPAPRLMDSSEYDRAYRLAQELKLGTSTPEDFVQRVERHFRRGFSYTESPPAASADLEGFLVDTKSGYCQQFSGAMALLLRMGGVPARVSTGFTSGSYDRKTREYVVRDFDAHSWVEVWYAGIGWVTFDPTPASSPARSQPDESSAAGLTGASPRAPDLGDIRSDPSRRALAPQEGTPWRRIAIGAGLALAALGIGLWLLRRHRRRVAAGWGPLAELERALRRMRRGPRPGTTLRAIETGLASAPAAAYVRAIREQRYGARASAPTAAQRRALRAELSRGRGLGGRIRAWWAMPPRPR